MSQSKWKQLNAVQNPNSPVPFKVSRCFAQLNYLKGFNLKTQKVILSTTALKAKDGGASWSIVDQLEKSCDVLQKIFYFDG